VVPIENSLSGSIHSVYEQLLSIRLSIVAECISEHSLCLCSLPGAKLEDIKEVLSHPHILEQCIRWINTKFKDVVQTPTWDTAGSCTLVKEKGSKHLAAIATYEAAEFNNLEVLEKEVGDLKKITTRYIIVEKNRVNLVPESAKILKCSIAVALPNEPMALFKILSCFAFRSMNVTKIDTRPASTVVKIFDQSNQPSNLWEYLFYFDFTTVGGVTMIKQTLENIKQYAITVRDFGYYLPYDSTEDLTTQSVQAHDAVPWTAYL